MITIKKLTLGSDGIFPIVNKPNSKFYVLTTPNVGYYVSVKYLNLYCLTYIEKKSIVPESAVTSINTYFGEKTRQESLNRIVRFCTEEPGCSIYEFLDREEFLKSCL